MRCRIRISWIGRLIILTALWAGWYLPSAPLLADIYRWQDEQGIWHFSDAPTSDAPIRCPPTPAIENSPHEKPQPMTAADAASAEAVHPNQEATGPPPCPTSGGLLWRIHKQGTADSWLLGTIHSADPRVVNLKPAVRVALDRADRFVMEMEMDASALTTFGTRMLLTDGSTLASLLGSDLYGRVIAVMNDYGMPETFVDGLKPWVVMALLSMPKPSAEPVLDMVLQQQAAAAGKPTAGLESPAEQLAVFEGMSLPDQIALLKNTLEQLPLLPQMFEDLIQAYAADDLRKIAAIADQAQGPVDSGALKRFSVRLNDERNLRMRQRMLPYLNQGNSFIAVGALHLAGPVGLLAQLRQMGYQTEAVR